MEVNQKTEEKVPEPVIRQILIETDGKNVVIKKAEVKSLIEFSGILDMVSKFINSSSPQTAPRKAPEGTQTTEKPVAPETIQEVKKEE